MEDYEEVLFPGQLSIFGNRLMGLVSALEWSNYWDISASSQQSSFSMHTDVLSRANQKFGAWTHFLFGFNLFHILKNVIVWVSSVPPTKVLDIKCLVASDGFNDRLMMKLSSLISLICWYIHYWVSELSEGSRK